MKKPDSKKREDDILFHNLSKARQTVRLLFARQDFQKAVDLLRAKWGVEETNPDYDSNIKKLWLRPFWDYTFHKPPQSANKEEEKCFYTSQKYYNDIVELMRQFKLDYDYWLYLLSHYVLTGVYDIEDMQSDILSLDTFPLIDIQIQEPTDKPKIVIELGDKTTLKDVKAIWHRVEEMRKRFHPEEKKFKEWKNFERDAKIYALHKQGKTIDEIYRIILDEYKQDLDYGNIKKIVSIFKNKLRLDDNQKLITSNKERERLK